MALGTITNVALDPHSTSSSEPVVLGDICMTVTTVVGDSAYAAGGTLLSGTQLGMPRGVVLAASCTITNGPANTVTTNAGAAAASYNTSTGKLQMWAGTGTNPAGGLSEATGNLSGLTVTVVAFGY